MGITQQMKNTIDFRIRITDSDSVGSEACVTVHETQSSRVLCDAAARLSPTECYHGEGHSCAEAAKHLHAQQCKMFYVETAMFFGGDTSSQN